MSNVSAFQRQKLYFVFDRFFDVDRSGSINKKDFELGAEKIGERLNLSKDDPKYALTCQKFLLIWEALRPQADSVDEISREKWFHLWYEEELDKRQIWRDTCLNFMFSLHDPQDDGTIDMDQFSSVCSNFFGVQMNESRKAFELITKNGTIPLSLTYYSQLWTEYFNSNDPSVVGNFVFGKTSFSSPFRIPKIVISACRRFKGGGGDKPMTYDLKSLTPPTCSNYEQDWPPQKIH